HRRQPGRGDLLDQRVGAYHQHRCAGRQPLGQQRRRALRRRQHLTVIGLYPQRPQQRRDLPGPPGGIVGDELDRYPTCPQRRQRPAPPPPPPVTPPPAPAPPRSPSPLGAPRPTPAPPTPPCLLGARRAFSAPAVPLGARGARPSRAAILVLFGPVRGRVVVAL